MSTPSCTFVTLVSRVDMPFLRLTLPHLSRMLAGPFAERIILADTAPLSAARAAAPGVGSQSELIALCEELCAAGHFDRVLAVRDGDPDQRRIYRSHFRPAPRETRDYRGLPSIARVLVLEEPATDHVVYFDSDMLFHQPEGHGWVARAIQLLEENPDLMFVGPLPGPPAPDGALRQRGVPFERDPRGFYRFRNFTSRVFAANRARFRELLPIRPLYTSWKRRLLSRLLGGSALHVWETIVDGALRASRFSRADTAGPEAWSLHPPAHVADFVRALPGIIARVERGDYPPGQAGDYDLRLELW